LKRGVAINRAYVAKRRYDLGWLGHRRFLPTLMLMMKMGAFVPGHITGSLEAGRRDTANTR